MSDDVYIHEIRVGWGDCDPAQIAYSGRIPVWALEAIDGWWEHNLGGDGWYQMELDRGFGTPFVRMALDFRSPITPRHRLKCHVWPNRLGETSVGFHVDGYQDGKLCFEGDFVSVFIRSEGFRKAPPPEDVRRLVASKLREKPDGRGAN